MEDHNIQRKPTSTHISAFRALDDGPGSVVRHVAETRSTNADAREWARAGAPAGAVIVADFQTAGRGRHGRQWAGAPGLNLLFSVVLRPSEPVGSWGRYGMVAGLAVCGALEQDAQVPEAGLKWPNDILVEGRKCGGILLEREPESGALVVGVGVNVHQTDFPPDLATPATSVLLATGHRTSRESLFHGILNGMKRWMAEDAQALLAAYTDRLVHMGQEVTIRPLDGHRAETGRCVGVSADGGLVVSVDGQHRTFHAGDVTLRPV